jgi:soluble lytic murein transglycosylase
MTATGNNAIQLMQLRNHPNPNRRSLSWLARTVLVVAALGAALPVRALDGDSAFLAAREAFQKGHIDRVNRLAADLAGHPLEPYVVYWQLRSRLSEASPAEIESFLREQGDALVAQRLRADWLKQLGKRQEWESFLREYPRLALDDSEVTCYALQARLTRQDSAALRDARPLWFQGAPQPDSCASLFDTLRAQGMLSEDDVWTRFRLALESGNLSFAKSFVAWLPAGHRFDPRQLEVAARNPQRLLDRRPLPLKTRADQELAMFATWRLAQSLPQVAAVRLDKISDQLSAEQQGYVWGQLALAGALKLRPESLDWFKRAADTPLTDRQLSWKTRMALRAGDWSTVLSAVDAMSPKERQFAGWRYWKARALLASGRSPEAQALLSPLCAEHNFYGQLAAEELGIAPAAAPEPHLPSPDEQQAAERDAGIQRALRFYQLGLRYEGALEWRWTTRNFDDRQLLAAADVARRAGWYERAIDTAERTRELHDFALRYPAPYREVVSTYTQQAGLDEAWVYGLMRQESRFTTDARSSAGAQGLMQLMPATAKQVARRMGLSGYSRNRVTSVDTNISLGTYHLRELLENLESQSMLASAAYNAGLSRAREWRGDRALEGAIYVESIPFTETRDYVRKVMSNTMYYARLFGQPLVALKQRLGSVAPRPLAND